MIRKLMFIYTSHQFMIPLWCLLYTSDQLMILKMMFIVYIASACDSYDDDFWTHCIILWFLTRNDVMCTHYSYDSKDDVMCTYRTRVTIWVDFFFSSLWHHGYGSRNDLMCTRDIRVMIPQIITRVHIAPCQPCDWEMILFPSITA